MNKQNVWHRVNVQEVSCCYWLSFQFCPLVWAVLGLFHVAQFSLLAPYGVSCCRTWPSLAVASRLSCSMACGILFP